MSEIAQIKISNEYFLKSRNEYSNPIEWIWFREAIQNSSDAGARNIAITIENGTVTFVDDGCGMSESTILNKFLTLGGSQKDANSIGGFGKAKEILCYTWKFWSLSSNHAGIQNYIDSDMIGNSPISKAPTNKIGTTLVIQIDNDMIESRWIRYAKSFIQSCKSNINFTVNGELVETSNLRGRYSDLGWASVMTNKSRKEYLCYVRMKGITMFTMSLSVPLIAVIELNGDSVTVMNSSRENLRWEYRDKFDEFVAQLNVNPEGSTRKKSDTKIMYFKGDSLQGKIDVLLREYELMLAEFNLTPEEITAMVARQTSGVHTITEIKNSISTLNLPSSIEQSIHTIIEDDKIYYGKMGYQYIVKLEGIPKPYMDVSARNAQTILHMWTKIIMYLGKKTGIKDINVGLLFKNKDDEEKVRGQYVEFNNKKHVLINPMFVRSIKDATELGLQLFPIACHEMAHHTESNHNEYFTSLYGNYLQFLSEDWDELRKLFNQAKLEVASSY